MTGSGGHGVIDTASTSRSPPSPPCRYTLLDSTWEPFTVMEFFLLLAASDGIAQQLVARRRSGLVLPPPCATLSLLQGTLGFYTPVER